MTPGASLTVRPATGPDATALTRVAREAKASWGYPAAWLREWEPALTLDAEYIERHTVLVAEVDGRIAGFVALEHGADGPEISHLWVLPAMQRRGVGRALLTRLTGWARPRGITALRVESDPNAQAFYERMGALRTGEVDAPVAGVHRTLPVLILPLPASPRPRPDPRA